MSTLKTKQKSLLHDNQNEQITSAQDIVFSVNTKEGNSFLANRGESILVAGRNNGLVFGHSCLTGRCRACITNLISGDVEELCPQLSLTNQDQADNRILMCCCGPLTDLEIDAVDLGALAGIRQNIVPAKVKSLILMSDDVMQVTLRFPPSQKIDFVSGQYVDVRHGELVRSYSIASSPEEAEMQLLIKNYPFGQMSKYWFEQAKIGDLLRVEGPKGTFVFRDLSQPLIFMATGTGIAPIISILNSLNNKVSAAPQQLIKVYWGRRNDTAFFWEPRYENLCVDLVKVNSQPSSSWGGRVGYVQDNVLQDYVDLSNGEVYACGSINMIEDAKKKFFEVGLKESNFFYDAFVASN